MTVDQISAFLLAGIIQITKLHDMRERERESQTEVSFSQFMLRTRARKIGLSAGVDDEGDKVWGLGSLRVQYINQRQDIHRWMVHTIAA